ncbi:MAG: hypothetical protein WCG25_03675 [bacterium]
MKKVLFFSIFASVVIIALQSCVPCGCNSKQPVGVIQFDSVNHGIITGYDWTMVDTTGGCFTTIPAGFETNNYGNSKLETKQIKWVEGMLIQFQRQYKVKVRNYSLSVPDKSKDLLVTVFFEPAVNPMMQKLEEAYQESIDQNQELNDLIDNLSASNRQMKKEFKELKKKLEEKK